MQSERDVRAATTRWRWRSVTKGFACELLYPVAQRDAVHDRLARKRKVNEVHDKLELWYK